VSPEELRAAMQNLCATIERGGIIAPATATLARVLRVELEHDTPEARARRSKRERMQRYRKRLNTEAVDAEPSTQASTAINEVDAQPSTKASRVDAGVDAETSTKPSTVDGAPSSCVDAEPSTQASTLARAVSEKDLRSLTLREEKETQNAREGVDARPSTPASTLRPIARAAREAMRADLVAQLERHRRRRDDLERTPEERRRGRDAVERIERDLVYFDAEPDAQAEARSA
jgi:hypothetical protein